MKKREKLPNALFNMATVSNKILVSHFLSFIPSNISVVNKLGKILQTGKVLTVNASAVK